MPNSPGKPTTPASAEPSNTPQYALDPLSGHLMSKINGSCTAGMFTNSPKAAAGMVILSLHPAFRSVHCASIRHDAMMLSFTFCKLGCSRADCSAFSDLAVSTGVSIGRIYFPTSALRCNLELGHVCPSIQCCELHRHVAFHTCIAVFTARRGTFRSWQRHPAGAEGGQSGHRACRQSR